MVVNFKHIFTRFKAFFQSSFMTTLGFMQPPFGLKNFRFDGNLATRTLGLRKHQRSNDVKQYRVNPSFFHATLSLMICMLDLWRFH